MLIDCDTCTVRGQGCDDCVVTVLLGAPPGWRGSDPTVVPMTRRPKLADRLGDRRGAVGAAPDEVVAGLGAALVSGPAGSGPDTPGVQGDRARGVVVELDDVERRAVRALAEVGLVPPLRHQPPTSREVG